MVEALAEFAARGLLAILLAFVLYFAAATAHERSHWLVGRLWSDEVTVMHVFGFFPASVDFRAPYDVPPTVIRVAGIAPVLFCLPTAYLLFTLVEASFLVRLLLAVPFAAAAIVSPSDLLAFCYPERFQQVASEHEKMGHVAVLRLLIDEVRS